MIIPVRCYTCNKVIGHLYEPYTNLVNSGKTKGDSLDLLNIKRYCCRTIFLGHVDLIDKVIKYSESSEKLERK